MILAIDPGPTHSAFFVLEEGREKPWPWKFQKLDNDQLLYSLRSWRITMPNPTLVVEMIASYGMPVGREVFETCLWIGRFVQAWSGQHELVTRGAVKLHLCGSPRAKDANIRQALLDRFGGKETAVGKKSSPGVLYGVSGDVWAALAVAVTYADQAAKARRDAA